MRRIIVGLLLAASSPALAQKSYDPREFCPDRPGLDTPACTIDKGHLMAEAGIGDWTLDRQPDSRTDTITLGDISLRYGVGDTTEVRLGWTASGHVRERDRISGDIRRISGIGDVTLGVKQNLHNPDGSGFSVALLPYATLPTGRDEVGAGDWGGGMLIPVSYALSETLTLEATPEADAAVNESGDGRHFAYGSAVGLQAKLGKKAAVTAELQAIRDCDPGGHTSQVLAGLSGAYQPKDGMQFDAGVNAGLNRKTPDLELFFGVVERF